MTRSSGQTNGKRPSRFALSSGDFPVPADPDPFEILSTLPFPASPSGEIMNVELSFERFLRTETLCLGEQGIKNSTENESPLSSLDSAGFNDERD